MKTKTRDEKIEALSKADKYALAHFNGCTNVTIHMLPELFNIGKEISESLDSDMWEPSSKDFTFNSFEAYPAGVNTKTERNCDTLEEAERCLRNEQIQNRINSWIREENKKAGYKADWKNNAQNKYFPQFNNHLKMWMLLSRCSLRPTNQEVCSEESGDRLTEMLNAGMIKDVPAKMEVD